MKTSRSNFPKKEQFLPPDTHMYVCVLGGKKLSIFGKFDVLYYLFTSYLRIKILPVALLLTILSNQYYFIIEAFI